MVGERPFSMFLLRFVRSQEYRERTGMEADGYIY